MNDVSVLKQALPYIRLHKGHVFLVKLGGNLVQDEKAVRSLAEDVALLHHVGIRIVLVHGGGPQATDLSRRLGIEPEIVEGRRVTDEQTLEVAKMVFAGKISVELLSALRRQRLRAVGLSGVAGDLVRAHRREVKRVRDPETGEERDVDYGHVGDIESVDTSLLRTMLDAEVIPVVSSLGGDDEGHVFNINADTVASALAVDLEADKLITLTDVPGLLRDPEDRESVVSVLTCTEAESGLADGTIRGGMAPKVRALVEAVQGGVARAHIIDGFEPHTLLLEVFTRRGRGTMIAHRGAEEDVPVSFDPVRLLRDLVRLETPSGQEDEAVDLVAATLRAAGAEARIVGRNVVAEAGPEGAPALLLNSHLDTVPAGPGWSRDPHEPGDDADRVWGLGANDAGGAGVALLDTFLAIAGNDLPARLVLALTCDEETGGEGLEIVRPTIEGLAAAVIGEPTGLRICPAQRGLIRFELTATGRSAHASRPWQGENAIEAALEDVGRILALRFPNEHPLLGPATLAVTKIEGGTAANVVPDRCVVTGDARPTPLHPNEAIVEALRGAVRRGELTTLRARMTPVETPLEADIVQAAREALPDAEIAGFGGVSDLFHARDVPGIVLGPGAPERSHAADEWIGVDEIREASAAYRRLVDAWLRRVG